MSFNITGNYPSWPNRYGRLFGVIANVIPTIQSSTVYASSGVGSMVGENNVNGASTITTTSTWPTTQPFGTNGERPTTATTLDGSSIATGTNNDRQITLNFANRLGSDYTMESLWISINYLQKPSQATYTQLMHNGKLLGNISATNYVSGTGTAVSPGGTAIVRDKFVFKYNTNVLVNDIYIKFTIKDSAGNKRMFTLYRGSYWNEIAVKE